MIEPPGSSWIHTFTHYRIAGSERLFICDECVNRRYHTENLPITLMIGALLLFVLGAGIYGWIQGMMSSRDQTMMILLAGLAGFCAFALYLFNVVPPSVGRRIPAGDWLAIRIREAELRRLGYDSFFRRDQEKELK